jgi:DNA (cytosine-5)-methyltransferase 1
MAKFISLFAGVGGFDLGMEQAGHECVAQVEWDKNAAGVLKHRWPNVPLFCDVSKVTADDLPDADFITYGFPCQDLSVAGKREGLDGKRSGLFYEATRLIRELRTRGCRLRFAVAENVGGLFSADDGVALARCIRELLDSGACETGWRLVDSQYFGVAQRRKRVFIVSDFGGESCDEILAITESLPGYPAPSRKAGKGTAGDAGAGFTASSFGGYEQGCGTLRSQGGDLGGGSETLAVNAAFSDGSQTSSSLTTRCHDQFMPDKGNFCAVIQAQSTGSDPDLMATLCAKDNDKIGSNQWVKEGKAIIEGVDWYNNAVTGDINHTLKIGGDVPGVIEQKETYCLQGGGETSQSSQGSGVNKDVAFTLNGLDKHGVAYEQEGIAFEPRSADGEPRITGDIKEVVSPTLNCMGGGQREPSVVSWNGDTTPKASEDVSVTLRSQQGGEGVGVAHALTVRRLTPIECERLQGFPDNWTSEKMELILEGNEWKATGKVVKQADGPRYKAMGNAVTVNVAEWIGKQIGKVLNK